MAGDEYGFGSDFDEVSARFQQLTGLDVLDFLSDPKYEAWTVLPTPPGAGLSQLTEISAYTPTFNEWRSQNAAAIQRLLAARGRSTFYGSGGPVDIDAIFGPLKGEIDKLTQQSMQAGRASITRGTQQAEEFASESLAGTGFGRSGIGAGMFQRLGQGVAGKIEASDSATRLRGDEAKFRVDQQIASLKLAEELRERGFNEEDIRSAMNFHRQMELARLQSSLEIAANEPTFWEEYGPLFQIIGDIGGAIIAA